MSPEQFSSCPLIDGKEARLTLSPTGHVGEVLIMSSGDGFSHTFTQ